MKVIDIYVWKGKEISNPVYQGELIRGLRGGGSRACIVCRISSVCVALSINSTFIMLVITFSYFHNNFVEEKALKMFDYSISVVVNSV